MIVSVTFTTTCTTKGDVPEDTTAIDTNALSLTGSVHCSFGDTITCTFC
jgi:hypothetical protein